MNGERAKQTVLIVEDDSDLVEILEGYLGQAGYGTIVAGDGLMALEQFYRHDPALVLLDLNLPRLSGLEVLRTLREDSRVPIIALTARVGFEDRLRGFEGGADDYIPKPFWPLEVVARVEAVLRRVQPPSAHPLLGGGGLVVSLLSRTVVKSGTSVRLRPAEFEILACLMRAPGRAFTRAELIEACAGSDSNALERTIDSHVARLRSSLGLDHAIQTVHGIGYRYDG